MSDGSRALRIQVLIGFMCVALLVYFVKDPKAKKGALPNLIVALPEFHADFTNGLFIMSGGS